MTNAPNRTNPIRLMDYLASDDAQVINAITNYMYPVNPSLPIPSLTRTRGRLIADQTPMATIAIHRQEAARLVYEVKVEEGISENASVTTLLRKKLISLLGVKR